MVATQNYLVVDQEHILQQDIIYLEAKGSYTAIYTEAKEYLLRKTLKEIENDLKGLMFYRIHRSYIVNFHYLKTMSHKEVLLTSHISLPIARGKFHGVKEAYTNYVRSKV